MSGHLQIRKQSEILTWLMHAIGFCFPKPLSEANTDPSSPFPLWSVQSGGAMLCDIWHDAGTPKPTPTPNYNAGKYREIHFTNLVGGFNPFRKIWVSWDYIVPNIWKNNIDVPNHQPVTYGLGCPRSCRSNPSYLRWIVHQGFTARRFLLGWRWWCQDLQLQPGDSEKL